LTYNLDFQSQATAASYGHDPYTHANYQDQRSYFKTQKPRTYSNFSHISKASVETNDRTDTADRTTFPANTVGNQPYRLQTLVLNRIKACSQQTSELNYSSPTAVHELQPINFVTLTRLTNNEWVNSVLD